MDEVPMLRKSPRQEKSLSLRRSTRKRSIPAAQDCPQSAKKSHKATAPSTPAPPPTLLNLPLCAITRLLLCLDVNSLENLSATCSYFDQLIAGRFLTSIDFPFPMNFIKEILQTNCLDKKPLLKLRCKKSSSLMSDGYSEPTSIHKLLVYNDPDPNMIDYLVLTQMSLLSLHKVRELDLVPYNMLIGWRVMNSYMCFDNGLLQLISRQFYKLLFFGKF